MEKFRLIDPQWRESVWERGHLLPVKGEDKRYLKKVLRLREGDAVEVSDGFGRVWTAALAEDSSGELALELREPLPSRPAPFPVYLVQALPKKDRFEFVLQKGTEVGVHRFAPALSRRTVVELKSAEKVEKRLSRWKKIVLEASRQSRRDFLPQVDLPRPLEEAVAQLPTDIPKLLLWEREEVNSLKRWLSELEERPKGVAIIVGPEGGFEADEVERLRQMGVISVGLGPLILRTETAGPVVAAILQYQFGILG